MSKPLELSPEEQAKLDQEFPLDPTNPEAAAPDPTTPETPPADAPPAVTPDEVLAELQSIRKQLEEKETPETPPTPPADAPAWVPKSWDDVVTKAEEAAAKAITDKEAAESKQAEEHKTAVENLDKEIATRIGQLESSGRIPKIVDATSDTDPGVAARKELFAYASQFNTIELASKLDEMKPMHDKGLFFDYKTMKWTEKVVNPGKDAPVGSSSHTTPAPASGDVDYKLIHGKTLDQLAEIGMRE